MRPRPLALLLLIAVGLTGLGLLAAPAGGDAQSDRAVAAARRRGQELWTQRWSDGGKACTECHASGPNQMRGMRLKSYPKWDKSLLAVVTGQQKLNHMIETQCGGAALPLGSDDLNALELYVSSLR